MKHTVNQVNFTGNLILRKAKIHKIKLLQNCKFSTVSFQFSQNQVATKLVVISNLQKKEKKKPTCCKSNSFYSTH